MGLQPCQCSASVNETGSFTFPLVCYFATVEYSLEIEICPNCQLPGSTVSASLFANLSQIPLPGLPDQLAVSFEGNPIGLPNCRGNALTVDVGGTLVVNGIEQEVTVTLSLNEAPGQVCLLFENALPVIGDSVCINVGPIDIEPCNGI